jgi:hypothetical protein
MFEILISAKFLLIRTQGYAQLDLLISQRMRRMSDEVINAARVVEELFMVENMYSGV